MIRVMLQNKKKKEGEDSVEQKDISSGEEEQKDSSGHDLSETGLAISEDDGKMKCFTWDYCIVFKMREDGALKSNLIKVFKIIHSLKQAGLTLAWFKDLDKKGKVKFMFVLVGMEDEKLEMWANLLQVNLLMDWKEGLRIGQEKNLLLANKTWTEHPYADPHRPLSFKLWQNVYLQYKRDLEHKSIYTHYPRDENKARKLEWNGSDGLIPKTIFNTVTRLRLMYSAMTERSCLLVDNSLIGAEIDFEQLIQKDSHPMKAFFPMHQPELQEWFDVHWMRPLGLAMKTSRSSMPDLHSTKMADFLYRSFAIPVQPVRNYFGEYVAFYFAFLNYISWWFLMLTGAGTIMFIHQCVTWRIDTGMIGSMVVFTMVWFILFVVFWKRKEAEHRELWGMGGFLEQERKLPGFTGSWKVSEVDGQLREEEPFTGKLCKMCFSAVVILIFYGAAFAFVIPMMRLKSNNHGKTGLEFLIAVGTGLGHLLLDAIFNYVSEKLSVWENHRTKAEFETARIVKTFLFGFVNHFLSLYWIAFCDVHVHPENYMKDGRKLNKDEINDAVLSGLAIQLFGMYLTLMFSKSAGQIVFPIIWRWSHQEKDESKKVRFFHREIAKLPYDDCMDDLFVLILQFGYSTLFVISFPILPVLALLSIMVEIRVDSFKLIHMYRRPVPFGASGLGLWNTVLDLLRHFCIFTNVALFVFCTSRVDRLLGHRRSDGTYRAAEVDKAWAFVIFVAIMEIFSYVVHWVVPEKKQAVRRHAKRQKHIQSALVLGNDTGEGTAQDRPEKLDVQRTYWKPLSTIPTWEQLKKGDLKFLKQNSTILSSLYILEEGGDSEKLESAFSIESAEFE